MIIERYVLEAYHKEGNHWEELLGNYSIYHQAVQHARDLADGGTTVRIIAQKYEYSDSELVEEFKGEHGQEQDDG